ncbi:hypothetical protein AAG570_008336 [Ranatra chinensis]|uniref:DNA polymerase alpha subunit B n=1 Tax=Ranatra chinensis TaxID=642074 RepID=A0ABD0XSW1_9HEMI
MSHLDEFSLFPGQIIVFEGKLIDKNIIATKLYTSATLPQLDSAPNITVPLQILVASGPFTHLDTMSYEPLNDLLDYVSLHQPNFLFLIGPIMDASHDNVKNGDVAELFSLYHSRLLDTISQQLSHTKVFYISSSKDVFSIPVYPTPPPTYPEGQDKPKVTVLPDPSLLNINGCIMGITATDTLLHLGKKEISKSEGNRLGRLAGHLLQQCSFYPLYPPDPDVILDLNLWSQYTRLPVTPHILVTPSGLHHFIKVVEGCIVVNPERLAKGLVGGTFASIEVRPKVGEEKWSPSSHISVQIVKI